MQTGQIDPSLDFATQQKKFGTFCAFEQKMTEEGIYFKDDLFFCIFHLGKK